MGKSGPAPAGTEYWLMPSACRLIVWAYRLLLCACQLPIEVRKLRNQMKQFVNPGGILASLPSLNLSLYIQQNSLSGIRKKSLHCITRAQLTQGWTTVGQPFWNLQFRYFVLPCTNMKAKY